MYSIAVCSIVAYICKHIAHQHTMNGIIEVENWRCIWLGTLFIHSNTIIEFQFLLFTNNPLS